MTRSPEAQAYHKLYRTKRWQDARSAHLAAEPLCRMCLAQQRITPATIVDHIIPHRGDLALFWSSDNHQSLCAPHHDIDKAREERGIVIQQIGADGWPV